MHCLVKVELSKDENVSNASLEIEANDSSAVIECNALIGEVQQNTVQTEGGFQTENKQTTGSRNKWFDDEVEIQCSLYRK